ncbi:hypothetical protein QYE76_001717 [Lolium multiflorum]|uniref:Transposase MuDR plant domain-containing protein n=1 Tax=Lolium multiflorum TaxID=4521 RepID=A0AAD8RNE3_LOLMU|nr:hypothetical protein QYE76_001717 [Lolium multiflorum]
MSQEEATESPIIQSPIAQDTQLEKEYDEHDDGDNGFEMNYNNVGDLDAYLTQEDMDHSIPYSRCYASDSDDDGPDEEVDEDGLTAKEAERAEIFKKVTRRDIRIPLFRDVSLADGAVVDGGKSLLLGARPISKRDVDARTAMIFKGLTFDTFLELKVWLKEFSIKHHRPYTVVHSDLKTRYMLKCVDKRCPWVVRARPFKKGPSWHITSCVATHMCRGPKLDGKDAQPDHRQLTSEFIAYKLSAEISSLPTMSIRSVQDTVKSRFDYDVKYGKAWKAKQATFKMFTAPGRIPSLKELQEELEGQARMAAKVQEAENKRASKARIREGERGQWWPCETTDVELRELQNEGMISAHWSFIRDTDVPKPGAGEVVMTKAWVERGLSLPCSEFFLSILNTYGLQPHNICPNSYLLLSNFVTLCEGHLGIRPDVRLWQFFFRVKKETKDKAMLNCGSMKFMLRPGRMYPPHDSHESVRYWNAGWFYEKNAPVPDIHDGLPKFINEPPEELASWSFVPSLAQTPILEKAARRISWLVHDGLTGAQLTLSWFTRRIQPLRHNARLICAYTGADDLLRATRHDLPADSLKRRIKMKIGRGQPVPELIKDIYTNNQCPPLNTLAEEKFRTILRVPVSDAAEEFPEDEEEEEEQAPRKAASYLSVPRQSFRLEAGASGPPPRSQNPEKCELEQDLLNAMLNNAWGKPDAATSEIQDFKKDVGQFFDKLICKQKEQQALHYELHKNISLQRRVTTSASSSLVTASSELENLRSSYQELETKLMEAEQKREQAEKQLAEKNSEFIKEKGEFVLKKNADSETIKRQQKELNGLRKYMETA